MTARSRFRFAGLLLAGATSAFLIVPVSAQQTGTNHLDCWFDAGLNAIQCPSHSLQEGRGATIDPDRVDRAFDILDPGLPGIQTPSVQTPDVQPVPKPRRAEKLRPERTKARTARTSRSNPGCRNYRTYNASTQTYRGYDGVVRQCRTGR